MASRTAFISKLLGLYCILAGLAMVAHKEATLATVSALIHNGPELFIVGIITLAAGLALVLGHNVWSGGVLPVVVTIMGWLTLLKGLLFLCLPPEQAGGLVLGKLSYAGHFHLYLAIVVIIGLYLTVAGFATKSE
ncbi:MAG: hypothetical protein ABSA32_12325 [Candidatus Acidiferrales bacterium]|jgi:hypothetical protein